MKNLISTLFLLSILLFTSCSDNPNKNKPEKVEKAKKGIINVSGAVEAHHEGSTWYNGVQLGNEGKYVNYTITTTDVLPSSGEVGSYSFAIRFFPVNGSFKVEEGEYIIGDNSKGVKVAGIYSDRSGAKSISYGLSPKNEGTITIESKTDNSVEVSFELKLYNSPNTKEGFIIVTGSISADCLTGMIC
jgi:hypothetical protein